MQKKISSVTNIISPTVRTPFREPLRNMKMLRRNRINDGDIEEMAFLSPRVLIQVLCTFPEDLINEVSPQSSILRKSARVPLVMILSCYGAFSGYVTVIMKCAGELVSSDM